MKNIKVLPLSRRLAAPLLSLSSWLQQKIGHVLNCITVFCILGHLFYCYYYYSRQSPSSKIIDHKTSSLNLSSNQPTNQSSSSSSSSAHLHKVHRCVLPSVLWHHWLGHLTRKNPSPIWPICVWWDVKPYSGVHAKTQQSVKGCNSASLSGHDS